jgi:hypothetical protein
MRTKNRAWLRTLAVAGLLLVGVGGVCGRWLSQSEPAGRRQTPAAAVAAQRPGRTAKPMAALLPAPRGWQPNANGN